MRSFECSVGESVSIQTPAGPTRVTVLASDAGVMRLRIEETGEAAREVVIGADRPAAVEPALLATAN